MRTRTILLVVAILLVAGFAALNWSEIVRPSPLSFGVAVMDAPLGLLLLAVLAVTLLAFLASTAAIRTRSLMDYRSHQKELEAQRTLADKAEASRFLELRQHLDTHLRELREREGIAHSEFEKVMLANRREMQNQMEQVNRTVAARLNELEHRLEARFERLGYARGAAVVPPVVRDEVTPATMREHAAAQEARAEMRDERQVREAQMREEERLRDERIREQRDLRRQERADDDRPAESGWRKWF